VSGAWSDRQDEFGERSSEPRSRRGIDGELVVSAAQVGTAGLSDGWHPHRALQPQPPRSDRPVVNLTLERIKRRLVLGGLITEYERSA